MKSEHIDVRVVERRMEALDVVAFRLASQNNGRQLPYFEPGAHIDVMLPSGEARKYSLANFSDDPDVFEIAVKREPQSTGGSKWLHEEVVVGSVLKISPPRNHFPLLPGHGRSLLLAAGIGITPIISMMRAHIQDDRPYQLHYFARGEAFAPYRNALAAERYRDHVRVHLGLDANATGKVLTAAINDARDAHVYYCGPPAFMAAIREISAGQVTQDRLHFEYFAPPAPQSSKAGGAFKIELARSKRMFLVPAEKSITDVLFENDIAVDTSCEAGICGSCKLKVLGGTPEHLDEVLSPSERARNDCLLPCVSRCHSGTLILDI